METLSRESAEPERTGVIGLNPNDQIDFILLPYRQVPLLETLPTPPEQRQMIIDVKTEGVEAARTMLETHEPLIAAAVYPFKGPGVRSDLLLKTGKRAFLLAIDRYLSSGTEYEFSEFAVWLIQHAVSQAFIKANILVPELLPDERPISGIIRLATDLESASVLEPGDMKNVTPEVWYRYAFSKMGPTERRVLPLIYLPTVEDVARHAQVSPSSVKSANARARLRLGVKTNEEMALAALIDGMKFNIRLPVPLSRLSLDERRVSTRLAQKDPAIAKELGMTRDEVVGHYESSLATTQAQSRIELLLMAHIHHFEPTEEEMAAAKSTAN